jgi:hypothetical protein
VLREIEVDLGFAKAIIPAEAWSQAKDEIELRFARLPQSELPAHLNGEIRGEAYNLGIYRDGSAVVGKRPSSLRVILPYEPISGDKTSLAVAFRIDESAGKAVPNSKYDMAAGGVSFTALQPGRYAVLYRPVSAINTPSILWATDSMEALNARGILLGDGNGRFMPERAVTRAEFVALLLRALELDSGDRAAANGQFEAEHWNESGIAEAVQLGIVAGRGDGTYGENESLTRQDMAVLLERAAKLEELVNSNAQKAPAPFADRDRIATYATAAVDSLQRAGWISGIGAGQFNPLGTVTRAQAAVLLWNVLKSQV